MWANAARLLLGSECRTGCINQLVNGWQRENLPHFLFSCWVSLTGDFPKMNNTSSPFNLESSHNEAFPISRLSRATSTVRLNSKLWWTNVRMRLLRHAQSHILNGCNIARVIYWCILSQKIRKMILGKAQLNILAQLKWRTWYLV